MLPDWLGWDRIALIVAALAVAWALGLVAALWFSRRFYGVALTADEIYFTRTRDGWTIPVARWKPAGPFSDGRRRAPVILCHGLGASALEFDIAEHVSLARYLRARGFDVWAVNLRGRESTVPPRGTGLHDYAVDHHIGEDVPAAIDLVKKETGAARVAWVGHSMGGIVIYGHAEATEGKDLACVATIGSPVALQRKPRIARAGGLLSLVFWPALHGGLASRFFAPILGYVHPPQTWLLLNPTNVEGWVMRQGAASAIVDLSVRVLRQFEGWSRTGKLVSEDGKRVYFERLAAVKTPWLAIGGGADKLVHWKNARVGFDLLGSEDKTWLLASREEGHSADYGHCDLVMGPRAAEDIFAPIAAFLETRAVEPTEAAVA